MLLNTKIKTLKTIKHLSNGYNIETTDDYITIGKLNGPYFDFRDTATFNSQSEYVKNDILIYSITYYTDKDKGKFEIIFFYSSYRRLLWQMTIEGLGNYAGYFSRHQISIF